MRKSTGKRQNLRCEAEKGVVKAKRKQGRNLPCSDKREIKNEIRGDFAAVDVREELCYHSLPKKQLEEGEMRRFQKNTKNSGKFCR